MKTEFVNILSDRINAASRDPKQLRALVYELARARVIEQFGLDDSQDAQSIRQMLESAIRDVETAYDNLQSSTSEAGASITNAAADRPSAQLPDLPHRGGRLRPLRSLQSAGRLAALLLAAAAIASALVYWRAGSAPRVAGSAERSAQQQPRVQETAKTTTQAPEGDNRPEKPLPAASPVEARPTAYGVYALSEGQLQELKPLVGRVPDRRVAISAPINTPSATTVAGGDLKFIVFKPDQAAADTSGPFEVRMIAKVARAMGVDSAGKASMTPTSDSWVIRNIAYSYKAGPIDDQPAMLLLQPESDGLILEPGRYAVVVKGTGYDFTVAGDVTDPNRCVERVDAANGAFYSPCPQRK